MDPRTGFPRQSPYTHFGTEGTTKSGGSMVSTACPRPSLPIQSLPDVRSENPIPADPAFHRIEPTRSVPCCTLHADPPSFVLLPTVTRNLLQFRTCVQLLCSIQYEPFYLQVNSIGFMSHPLRIRNDHDFGTER